MKYFNISLLLLTICLLVACASEQNIKYRDLNKNGRMDTYEDSTQPIEARVNDLLNQMTVEEKAGTMFIEGTLVNEDGSIEKKEDAVGFASILPSAVENIKGWCRLRYWLALVCHCKSAGLIALSPKPCKST